MPIYNYQCLFIRLNLKALIRGRNVQDTLSQQQQQKTNEEMNRENRLNFCSISLRFFFLSFIRKLQRHFFLFKCFSTLLFHIFKYALSFVCVCVCRFAHFFGRTEQINNRHECLSVKCFEYALKNPSLDFFSRLALIG